MRRRKIYVVDVRKIKPVKGVKNYQKELAYHGGGTSYRAYGSLNIPFYKPEKAPRWIKKEMDKFIGIKNKRKLLRTESSELREQLFTSKNPIKKIMARKRLKRIVKELDSQTKEMQLYKEQLFEKIKKGKFESDYGNISEKDVFNATVKSFAEGVLGGGLRSLKDRAIYDPNAKEMFECIKEMGNRKTRLSEVFRKPVTEISEEEIRRKIGKGEVFENDFLMIKSIKGTLSAEDIKRAEIKGIINDTEKLFYENMALKAEKVVFTSKGVSNFSLDGDILVEAKPTDLNKKEKGHFPVFLGILPPKSVRTIYTNPSSLLKNAKTEEQAINRLKSRVNTFNEARKIAERNGSRLRRNAKNLNELALKMGKDPYLIELAYKIAVGDKSLLLDSHKTKIPTHEI